MSTATTSGFETVADLVQHLGDIPLRRIRMSPYPGTATEADLHGMHKSLCELIDGVLVEKALGFRESFLASWFARLIHEFVHSHNIGIVTTADGTIRLFPGQVRIPDVAYFSWDRFPNRRLPEESIPNVVPDLAIEILSDSNTEREMLRKRQDYFLAGVIQVWEVDPRQRTVSVYNTVDQSTIYQADVILPGDPVLVGFTLELQILFGELDRHG